MFLLKSCDILIKLYNIFIKYIIIDTTKSILANM